jgi:hypothetical protein
MFNNLIESSSHRKEFKRRGSFVLFTTATYVLLLVITGVVSIYAYDARLEDQSLEVVVTLAPIDVAAPQPEHPRAPTTNVRSDTSHQTFDIRRVAMAPVDQSQATLTEISTHPNPDLPIRPGVSTVIGGPRGQRRFAGRIRQRYEQFQSRDSTVPQRQRIGDPSPTTCSLSSG